MNDDKPEAPPSPSLPARKDALCPDCYKEHLPIDHPCPDCQKAAKQAYSDATTPGFFHDKCSKHRKAEPLHGERSTETAPEQLVIEIARELYDRFVMGGWEPQDAYPQIRAWLGLTVALGEAASLSSRSSQQIGDAPVSASGIREPVPVKAGYSPEQKAASLSSKEAPKREIRDKALKGE